MLSIAGDLTHEDLTTSRQQPSYEGLDHPTAIDMLDGCHHRQIHHKSPVQKLRETSICGGV